MSIIFYHDDKQMNEALDVKKQVEMKGGQKIYTEILPFKHFYLAEGYHQKYYLQNTVKPYKEVKAMYGSFNEFVSSTLAARVNGYIAGNISLSSLKDELEQLEVSKDEFNRLIPILEDLR